VCSDGPFCNCLVRGKIREARRERKRKENVVSLSLSFFTRACDCVFVTILCVSLCVFVYVCTCVARTSALSLFVSLCLSLSLFVSKFLLGAVSAATSDPARSSSSPRVHNRSTLIFAAKN